MTRFKGCFSLRVSTCLFIFTLCGRITGALNERVRVTVMEEDDVILPCSLSTKENIESKLFDWKKDGQKEVFMYDGGVYYDNGLSGQDEQFKGRVSHFRDELKHGIASIKIQKTKVADSGNYTCVFPRLKPEPQTFHIELVVEGIFKDRRMIKFPGAASEPNITILDQTKDGTKLQCEVRGVSPRTKVKWKDSSENIIPAERPKKTERGGSYDIILEATVTKTDRYRCVVTQIEIYHRIHSDIIVYITEKPEKISQGDSTGWITAVSVLGFLLVAAAVIIVLLRKRLREKVVEGVLFAKGIFEVDHIKSRQRHEKGSENPPGSHHENGVRLRTEPLLPSPDVSIQISHV